MAALNNCYSCSPEDQLYLSKAGHPDCMDLDLPNIEDINRELQDISSRANHAVNHRQNAVTHLAEMRLENCEDDASGNFAPSGANQLSSTNIEGVQEAILRERQLSGDDSTDQNNNRNSLTIDVHKNSMSDYTDPHKISSSHLPDGISLRISKHTANR